MVDWGRGSWSIRTPAPLIYKRKIGPMAVKISNLYYQSNKQEVMCIATLDRRRSLPDELKVIDVGFICC